MKTIAAKTTLKIQKKVSIASWQLPNFLHFRFGAEHNSSVGHPPPSRDLSRYLINCRSGRALAKSAVSPLRSENREGNAERSTPTNTEHRMRAADLRYGESVLPSGATTRRVGGSDVSPDSSDL
jgi:hypothetical protein